MFRKDPASAHASYFFTDGRLVRLAVADIQADEALRTSATVRLDLDGGTTGVCVYLDPADARVLLEKLQDWHSADLAATGGYVLDPPANPEDATLYNAEIEADYQRSDNEQV